MSKHTLDYGEPWKEGVYGPFPLDRVGQACDHPTRMKRAIDCTNALAGRDPAALGELERAVFRAVDFLKSRPRECLGIDSTDGYPYRDEMVHSLLSALAAFRAKEVRPLGHVHVAPQSATDGEVIKSLMEERERLWDVISWALGENGEFPTRQPGEGAYWWRKEMSRRLGAKGDTKPPLPSTTSEVAHPPEPVRVAYALGDLPPGDTPPSPPEPVVGVVYMRKNANDTARWMCCGPLGWMFTPKTGSDWYPHDRASSVAASCESCIRSGKLVPVTGKEGA